MIQYEVLIVVSHRVRPCEIKGQGKKRELVIQSRTKGRFISVYAYNYNTNRVKSQGKNNLI